MAERKGMGRGLSAILPTSEGKVSHDELRQLPITAIEVNPDQPRTSFDPEELESLAGSIVANGLLQPLLVKPLRAGQYQLIAGERRLRAAQLAGLTTVPTYVRADDTGNLLELALIENIARSDLNPIDEARALASLVEDLGISKEAVAGRVGKSRVAVSNLIRLLNLPDDVIEMLETGKLSEGHGRAILRAPDHLARRRLAASAVDRGWSVRETERQAEVVAAESVDTNGLPDVKAFKQTAKPTSVIDNTDLYELESTLAEALDTSVRFRTTRTGVKAEIRFDSIETAADFVERLALKSPTAGD